MELQASFSNILFDNDSPAMYTCTVQGAIATKPGTEITKIAGKQIKNVKAIDFKECLIEVFPRGLHKLFKSLTLVCMNGCGLKNISREDLNGLENLEELYLVSNKLKTLPSNLFVGMKKLKRVSLSDNQLDLTSSEFLKPIANNGLKLLNLQNNNNIDALYAVGVAGSVESVERLMQIIDKTFDKDKEFVHEVLNGLKDVWISGKFSDFTIVGGMGKLKEFQVHKNLLGSRSSVFAQAFHDGKTEMKIGDFSVEAIEGMLKFLYTGEIQENCNAIELFSIATKFDLKRLTNIGHQKILKNLDESNALEVFELGHQHNCEEIKLAAFKKIKEMFVEKPVSDKLMEKPENVKEIVEARRNRKRKIQEAEEEYQEKLQKFT